MDIVLFAGKLEQWRLSEDPAVTLIGDDLSHGQYFVQTNKSPPINLLFAALFDLIIYSTMNPGLLIPCTVEDRDLDAIFAEKVPKVKDNEC